MNGIERAIGNNTRYVARLDARAKRAAHGATVARTAVWRARWLSALGDLPWWGLGMERWYLTPRGLLWEHVADPSWPERWGLLELSETGRITARRVAPVVLPVEDGSAEEGFYRVAERALLLLELRKYQAQGITYRPLVLETTAERRARHHDVEAEIREARQLMGLEARA